MKWKYRCPYNVQLNISNRYPDSGNPPSVGATVNLDLQEHKSSRKSQGRATGRATATCLRDRTAQGLEKTMTGQMPLASQWRVKSEAAGPEKSRKRVRQQRTSWKEKSAGAPTGREKPVKERREGDEGGGTEQRETGKPPPHEEEGLGGGPRWPSVNWEVR